MKKRILAVKVQRSRLVLYIDLDRITGLTGFFCLAGHYPVDPACRGEAFLRRLVDPVKKIKETEYVTSTFIIRYSLFNKLCPV